VSKGLQIALGAFVVAGLLGWYATSNGDRIATFQYFQTLDEFQQAGPTGKAVRVHGYVALESIERDVPNKRVLFSVVNEPPHATGTNAGTPLRVLYATLDTPDMFKDGAEVVLEGRMGADAVFVADNVLAKCPSKFEAKAAEQASF
jgi:cytochrome c-type biogenesis protein CcmE